MIEQKVKVTTNIEAKSAALFVQTANKFTSNIKSPIILHEVIVTYF